MKDEKLSQLGIQCYDEAITLFSECEPLILGEGNSDAPIMVICEKPLSLEEALHKPIAGARADTLKEALSHIDVAITNTYCTNVIKYRTNRINPKTHKKTDRKTRKDEKDFFRPYIIEEIKIVQPALMIIVGEETLNNITDAKKDTFIPIHCGSQLYVPALFVNDLNELNVLLETDATVVSKVKKIVGGQKQVVKETSFTLEQPAVIETNAPTIKPKEEKEVKIDKKEKKVFVIYGGTGFADDSTLVVLNRLGLIFNELNIGVERLDLHKGDYHMDRVLESIQHAMGVVLATPVEWFGIGWKMTQFLDNCYQYSHQKIFEMKPLLAIVLTKETFEREALNHLIKAYEILGGDEGINICGLVDGAPDLETNKGLIDIIDRKIEDYYRTIQKNKQGLPTSNKSHKHYVTVRTLEVGNRSKQQNESQQTKEISKYMDNYDSYLDKQSKDIASIASLFEKKVKGRPVSESAEKALIQKIKQAYNGKEGMISMKISVEGHTAIMIQLSGQMLDIYEGHGDCQVELLMDQDLSNQIFNGKITVQRAFMIGKIKAKGNFKQLYLIDQLFEFNSN